MSNPWTSDTYSDEQKGALSLALREYRVTGEPQKAQILQMQMDELTPYEELSLPGDITEAREKRLSMRPETEVDPALLDLPPRTGPGSGQGVWQEFAAMVSNIDEEVIDQFTRDEIIQILIDRDIIDGDTSDVESGDDSSEDDLGESDFEPTTNVADGNIDFEGVPREPLTPGDSAE